nr:hypothetical protein GZ27E7_41 [uncultured archaeon GZfos27E7]
MHHHNIPPRLPIDAPFCLTSVYQNLSCISPNLRIYPNMIHICVLLVELQSSITPSSRFSCIKPQPLHHWNKFRGIPFAPFLKHSIFLMCLFNRHNIQYLNGLFLLVNSAEYRITSTYVHPEEVVTWKLQLLLVCSSGMRIVFQHFKLFLNQPPALFSKRIHVFLSISVYKNAVHPKSPRILPFLQSFSYLSEA